MLFNLLIWSTVLLAALAFGLGILSLVRNYKSKVVVIWFLMSMAITIWSIGYVKTLLVFDSVNGFLGLSRPLLLSFLFASP